MPECYCDYDYDAPSVYAVTNPTARKSHECSECRAEITPGTKYENVFGIWDGRPGTFKTCPKCLDLLEYVKAHVPCACFAHGNIHDDAIETAREWSHEVDGLLFGAYRRLIKARKQPKANHA